MNNLTLNVGTFKSFRFDLRGVDFNAVEKVVFTVRNGTYGRDKVIVREFFEPLEYIVTFSPKETLLIGTDAVYDFVKVSDNGICYKLTDNGRILLNYGVGRCEHEILCENQVVSMGEAVQNGISIEDLSSIENIPIVDSIPIIKGETPMLSINNKGELIARYE